LHMAETKRKRSKEDPAEFWLARRAAVFLRRAGLAEGDTVLDFGCHKGNYTLPAARIVCPRGKVYAVDKDKKVLDEARRTVQREDLSCVECIRLAEGEKLPVRARSVDIALLYDILHGGYLPEVKDRRRVLRSVHRALKPGGILSLYPTHVGLYGLTIERILREVRHVGFSLGSESRRRLVHDGSLVRGRVFTFRRIKAKHDR